MYPNDYSLDRENHEIRWRRRPTLDRAARLYFYACAAQVLIMVITRALSARLPQLALTLNYGGKAVFQLGVLLFPAVHYCISRPGMARGIRLAPPTPLALLLGVLAGVTGVFAADSLGGLWLILLESLGARLSIAPPAWDSPMMLMMGVLFSALLPAVCEEFLFRGVILSAFERRGRRRAILFSALLFASLHGNVEGLPVHLVMGLVLGICAVATGSLYSAMAFHLTYNLLMLALSVGVSARGSLLEQAGGLPGVGMMALRFGGYALVLSGILLAMWFSGASRRTNPPPKGPEMNEQALLVLMSGVITTLCVYLINALSLWGVLP